MRRRPWLAWAVLRSVVAAGALGAIVLQAAVAQAGTPQEQLTPFDPNWGQAFGTSLSMNGTFLVVGAPDDPINGNQNQGSVYVYTLVAPGAWSASVSPSTSRSGSRWPS